MALVWLYLVRFLQLEGSGALKKFRFFELF